MLTEPSCLLRLKFHRLGGILSCVRNDVVRGHAGLLRDETQVGLLLVLAATRVLTWPAALLHDS